MTERELQYAINLAKALARKHYPDVPQWKPADDLMTVLTQIDNMTTGMIRPAALAEDDAAVEMVARTLAKNAWVRSSEVDPGFATMYLERWPGGLDEYLQKRWPLYVSDARAAIRALGE